MKPYSPPPQRSTTPPPLRAALAMLTPLMVVRVLGAWLFHAWISPLLLLEILIFLFTGYTAGRYAVEAAPRQFGQKVQDECVRSGAGAGLTLAVGALLASFLLMLMARATPLGFLLPLSSTLIICGSLDIVGGLVLGALGGRWQAAAWK